MSSLALSSSVLIIVHGIHITILTSPRWQYTYCHVVLEYYSMLFIWRCVVSYSMLCGMQYVPKLLKWIRVVGMPCGYAISRFLILVTVLIMYRFPYYHPSYAFVVLCPTAPLGLAVSARFFVRLCLHSPPSVSAITSRWRTSHIQVQTKLIPRICVVF